jgi:hypothetical protein
MKKSKFTEAQIAFVLKQIEEGTSCWLALRTDPVCPKLSLRIDPCEHTAPTVLVGEIWSDRHGIFKCHQPLGIAL